jgi:hypothetical protein
MVSELISKYIWLIQTISGAGESGLSLGDISSKYERRYSIPYSRRTFNNHREAIEEIFGISIQCDRSTNRYSIKYSEDAMSEDSSVSWLINTFAVKNVLDLGKDRLSGRVSVEDTPSGQKFLLPLMKAMEDLCEVEIEYLKYNSKISETVHVQPFAIKEDKQRWYLIGYCEERAAGKDGKKLPNKDQKAWRIYSLDRIKSLTTTSVKFSVPKGFDVDDCFAQSYGPYLPDAGKKAVTIRFKATDSEAKYLRDLPLHRSQKEETPLKASRHIFSIRVFPNTDLIMEFCKRGARIEVLEPAEVREEVAKEIRKTNEIYNNKR